jgi:hypothetical protein
MGFCLECGEVTAQQLCFECFSRFDILEADAEFEEYKAYLLRDGGAGFGSSDETVTDSLSKGEEE